MTVQVACPRCWSVVPLPGPPTLGSTDVPLHFPPLANAPCSGSHLPLPRTEAEAYLSDVARILAEPDMVTVDRNILVELLATVDIALELWPPYDSDEWHQARTRWTALQEVAGRMREEVDRAARAVVPR